MDMNPLTTETRSHGGTRMNAATVYNSRGGKASAGLSSSGSSSATAPDFPFGPIPRSAGTKENGSSAGSAGAFGRRSMRSNHQAGQKAARTVPASRKPVMPKLSPWLYVPMVKGLLLEQRIHKFFRIKGQQIANFLAHADKSHREAQLARDGHNHATLRGAVEFGQHDAGHPRRLREQPSLLQAVLTGSCVHDEKRLVRRTRNNSLRGAAHFFQFGHEAGLGVQPACRIHDDVVRLPRRRCLQRVKQD